KLCHGSSTFVCGSVTRASAAGLAAVLKSQLRLSEYSRRADAAVCAFASAAVAGGGGEKGGVSEAALGGWGLFLSAARARSTFSSALRSISERRLKRMQLLPMLALGNSARCFSATVWPSSEPHT